METTSLACVSLKTRNTTSTPMSRQLFQGLKVGRPREPHLEKLRIRRGLTPRSGGFGLPQQSSKEHFSFSHLLENGIFIKKINGRPPRILPEKPPERRNSMSQESFKPEPKTNCFVITSNKLTLLEPSVYYRSVLEQVSKPSPKFKKISKLPARKIDSVSVRKAMRDKDWLLKSRLQIVKDFNLMLNKSNGMLMQPPTEHFFTYKYYLEKGNNSHLVKNIFKSRWYWTRAREEEKASAHICWTQIRDRGFLESLPTVSDCDFVEDTQKYTVTAKFKYSDPKSPCLLSSAKCVDIEPMGYSLISESPSIAFLQSKLYQSESLQVHNKLEGNCSISQKKGLFYNLKAYCEALGKDVFEIVPFTVHVTSPEEVLESSFTSHGYWIVKPGENSNRGNGITLCNSFRQIKSIVERESILHTFIVQKYIEKPFLINRRKFDIRCFALVTSFNGVLQGYFYNEGYLRTSSKMYNLGEEDRYVHLTNDAVQKDSEDYGKFENGNKLSFSDFQRYLDNYCPEMKANFAEEIIPKMRSIVKMTIEAVCFKVDRNKRAHTFEIFGYDFLIDSDLKPWLLETNTNPCLEVNSPILARIIPAMLENAFRVAVDPLFLEPFSSKGRVCTDPLFENKFELVFHSTVEGNLLASDPVLKGVLDSEPLI